MSTYPFICHDVCSFETVMKRDWSEGPIRYLLIDPGCTYFCARFEARSKDPFPESNLTSVNDEYVQSEGFILINFSVKTERWAHHSTLYDRVTQALDEHWTKIQDVHVVAIEKQVKQNPKMIRLSQHLISYFLIKYNQLLHQPLILEFHNQCKTREFGYIAPKSVKKNQKNSAVKKWAEKMGYDLLKARNDLETIKYIQESAKMNDPMDTVVMGEALAKILKEYTPTISSLQKIEKKRKAKKPRKKS